MDEPTYMSPTKLTSYVVPNDVKRYTSATRLTSYTVPVSTKSYTSTTKNGAVLNGGRGAYASQGEAGGKILMSPRLSVSALHNLDDLTMAFNFIVTLNSFTFGFQSVSGLSVERATETRSEGGVNDHGILCGMPNTGSFTLTFKRGVLLRTSELIDKAARIAASVIPSIGTRRMRMLAIAGKDPQSTLENGPAVGTIQVFNRERTHLRGLYSFLSLGMTSWRADDLDASNNSVWCEEITIAHTGLTRHPLQMTPNVHLTVPIEEKVEREAKQETEKQNEKQEQSEAKNQQDESQKKIDKLEEENKNLNNELEELKKKLKELEEQNKKQQQQKTEKTDQEDQKSSESSEESKNTQENTQENSESSGENKNTENTNTSSSTQK